MEKNNKELEDIENKYKKEKIEINLKSVDRFTKVLRVVLLGMIIPFVLTAILIILIALLVIKMFWMR